MGLHKNAAAQLDPWTKRELNRWSTKLRTGKDWTAIDVKRTARAGVAILCHSDAERCRVILKMILRWEKSGLTSFAKIVRIIRKRLKDRPQA